jgi:hypothetical protein
MPLRWFICPDNERIEVAACLKEGGCRMGNRCASRSYLMLASSERPWKGKPSTTQLINGTMCAFLRLTKDYAISPDARAFMVHGTISHGKLEDAGTGDDLSELELRFQEGDVSGISDGIETELNKRILYDTKTSGSFKVAKALGFYVEEEPTGEVYKTGKRKGEQKTIKVLKRSDEKMDRWEWELQVNFYRMLYEKLTGEKIDELKIQCIVRDGNTYIARSRGVFRNIYYFKLGIMPDENVAAYFDRKKADLLKALEQGYWNETCNAKENWDGLKCQSYCEVAEFCSYGKYLKREKEAEDMPIKGLSEVRRLPRQGKIRLGIKKISDKGKEYPAEVDYFILDPSSPIESEREKLLSEFAALYGDQPKSIKIMFPVASPEVYFPQFYKRYGSSTALKCKGDGQTAVCATEEFTKDLKVIGRDDLGLPKVECKGKDCPYYKGKECTEVGTLQVLLPELPGAGVWQITTGSYNSIVNLNSCIDYIKAACGRAHMIPLTLERREQETQHTDAKGTHKGKHYTLHIDMAFKLIDLQKYALIDPTKILLEMPAPDVDKADIVYEENATIEAHALTTGNGKEALVADITKKWDGLTLAHKKEFKAVYPNKIDTYDIPTLKKMVEQIDLAIEQA